MARTVAMHHLKAAGALSARARGWHLLEILKASRADIRVNAWMAGDALSQRLRRLSSQTLLAWAA